MGEKGLIRCREIGDGEVDSWFMPLIKQVEIACEKVKQMEDLCQGYNIVGRSQGNMVARGLIEFYHDGPPVYNYISLAGPHAGISSLPYCRNLTKIVDVCYIVDVMLKINNGSKYLQKVNNEIANQRNSTYKDRFTSLHNLVLVMFEDDEVIVPKESSWFWFYPDGETKHLLPADQTKLYTEDWIGLKTSIFLKLLIKTEPSREDSNENRIIKRGFDR